MRIRIAIGNGWYPQAGLAIEHNGETWVIESVEPDPEAMHQIDIVLRFTTAGSVIANLRPATADERVASAAQEKQDAAEFMAAMSR